MQEKEQEAEDETEGVSLTAFRVMSDSSGKLKESHDVGNCLVCIVTSRSQLEAGLEPSPSSHSPPPSCQMVVVPLPLTWVKCKWPCDLNWDLDTVIRVKDADWGKRKVGHFQRSC